MWLALAKLENYDKAKQILNKARKAIPHEISIWINASKLEEAQTPDTCDKQVDELIERSVRALSKYDVEVPTQKWVEEALNCNIGGSVKVCSAILKTAIKEDFVSLTNEDQMDNSLLNNSNKEKKSFWLEIAENSKHKGCLHMTKEIYKILLKYFKNDVDIWIKLIDLEKKYGTEFEKVEILKKSVESCSENEFFWLMYSNYKFKNESIEASKEVLNEALKHHPNKPEIILGFVKYLKIEDKFDEAQKMLKSARENFESSNNKIWIASIQLERQLGNFEKAFEICEFAMKKFPDCPKFFMIGGQMKESLSDKNSAAKIYERGIECNKKNCSLYVCWAKLFFSNPGIARSIFEKALKVLPNDDRIWYEFVKFENLNFLNLEKKFEEQKLNNLEEIYEENDVDLAKMKNNTNMILNKALKECPSSGLLWSIAIEIEKGNKHARASDALKKCENSIHVKTAVGKLYAEEKHIDKARLWFDSAVKSNPDYGETWVYYYKLEKQFGDDVFMNFIIIDFFDIDF
jgi:pre-mRNA-processing factor 6